METLNTIKNRRSIRSYTTKKVSKDKIKKILTSALYAPSSKNSQPWYFMVVSGKKKDKIADILVEKGELAFWIKKSSNITSAIAIRQAPVLILVFNKGTLSGGEKNAREDKRLVSAVIAESLSIGASIENMLLSAKSMGLGSLWIGDLRNVKPFVEKFVNTKYDLIAGVAIGYQAYKSTPRELPKSMNNIIKKF